MHLPTVTRDPVIETRNQRAMLDLFRNCSNRMRDHDRARWERLRRIGHVKNPEVQARRGRKSGRVRRWGQWARTKWIVLQAEAGKSARWIADHLAEHGFTAIGKRQVNRVLASFRADPDRWRPPHYRRAEVKVAQPQPEIVIKVAAEPTPTPDTGKPLGKPIRAVRRRLSREATRNQAVLRDRLTGKLTGKLGRLSAARARAARVGREPIDPVSPDHFERDQPLSESGMGGVGNISSHRNLLDRDAFRAMAALGRSP